MSNCPSWEYKGVVGHDEVLADVCGAITGELRRKQSHFSMLDTRPTHGRMFKDLTPVGFEYYAGNYRGSDFDCLKFAMSRPPGDSRVGCPPNRVHDAMQAFAADVRAVCLALDRLYQIQASKAFRKERLLKCIAAVCRLFDTFLRIHPYLNGNGHIARLAVVAMLGERGHWLRTWHAHPSPNREPFIKAIFAYRDGNEDVLHQFVLNCLIG